MCAYAEFNFAANFKKIQMIISSYILFFKFYSLVRQIIVNHSAMCTKYTFESE